MRVACLRVQPRGEAVLVLRQALLRPAQVMMKPVGQSVIPTRGSMR